MGHSGVWETDGRCSRLGTGAQNQDGVQTRRHQDRTPHDAADTEADSVSLLFHLEVRLQD